MDGSTASPERHGRLGRARLARPAARRAPVRGAADRAPHERRLRGARAPAREAVERGARRDFDGAQRDAARRRARAPPRRATRRRARRDRPRRSAAPASVTHVALTPRPRRRAAKREPAGAPITVVPLQVERHAGRRRRRRRRPPRRARHRRQGATAAVELHLVGQQALWAGMQDLTKERPRVAPSAIGFPIVLLILLAVFGSLAAAALPLALGFASVADHRRRHLLPLARRSTMSVFVTNVASMIGIGVAVDYSLFVLARYREEIRGGREPRRGAPHRRMRTSGIAVAFSRHHRDGLARRAVPGRLARRSARWRWARSSSWRSRSSRRSRCCRC